MYLACGVVHIVGEAIQGTAGIATHGSCIVSAHSVGCPSDVHRVSTVDKAIFHGSSHIGGLEGRMTVVEEPGEGTLTALQVIDFLIGNAHGAQGHAQVKGNILIVLDEGSIEGSIVFPVTAVSPVHGHDDDGVGVGAILADVVHPALHVGTEGLDIGAGKRTLLLQNDVAPGLAAHKHLGTGVTVLGHAIAFLPMGQERFAQQGVLGPVGILAHGLGNAIEHGILVVIIDEAVVQRKHLDLLGHLRHEYHVGRLQCHRRGGGGSLYKAVFARLEVEGHVIGARGGRNLASSALDERATGIVAREVALGAPNATHAQALIDAPVAVAVTHGRHGHLALEGLALDKVQLARGVHVVPTIVVADDINRGQTRVVVITDEQQGSSTIADGEHDALAHEGVAAARDVVVGAQHEVIRYVHLHAGAVAAIIASTAPVGVSHLELAV